LKQQKADTKACIKSKFNQHKNDYLTSRSPVPVTYLKIGVWLPQLGVGK